MSRAKTPSSQSTQRRIAGPTSASVRSRVVQAQPKKVQQPQVEDQLIELSHLSAAEREQILGVLERDAAIRKQEQARVLKLKKEIRDLRLRGVIRNEPGSDATDSCARCRQKFGWLFNKPVVCMLCSHRVCKTCVQPVPGPKNEPKFICSFCIKQLELEAMTGHWFEVLATKGKSRRVPPNSICAAEVVQASIRRSKNPSTDAATPEGLDEVDAPNNSNNNNNTVRLTNGGLSTSSTAASTGERTSRTTSSRGDHGSDAEEDEDIGEMFAAYGGPRRAPSQTNLERMSPFSSSKESIVSMYSNAGSESFGKFPVSGEIEFGMLYNYKQSSLEVHIKQCRGLAAVDQKRNSSDPYVKTYLLPDKTKNGKRKTRVKKHTTSPIFEEVLKYHVTKSELESRTLCVMVWHFDRFGRNDFLGEVNLGFDHHSFDDPTPKWHKLQDRQNLSASSTLTYKGDLNVCLRFISPETLAARRQAAGDGGSTGASGRAVLASAGQNNDRGGELQLVVKQARNLTAVRSNGFSDPFCKCSLLPDRTRGGSQKSPVVKRNCNPVWNHTFVFDNVSWMELKERSLELTVWDYDRIVSNDFLGGVRLNLGTGKSFGETVDWMDSKGEEISLWQAMLDRPNCWIEGTLLLRLHMGQRK